MIRASLAFLLVMPLAAMDLDQAVRVVRGYNFRAVRMAVEDLSRSHGTEYPGADDYLRRLRELQAARTPALAGGDAARIIELAEGLEQLRHEALLANPLPRAGAA